MSIDQRKSEILDPCAAVGEQLSAYLDGELSVGEAAAVEAHLRDCPDCARLCAALRALRDDLAAAQLTPPPALHGRIMAAVRRENRMRRLRRFTVAATAGVAAMFCFVVIGGAMLRGGIGADAKAFDAAPEVARGLKAENEAADTMLMYAVANDGAAMTGAVIDTTVEPELTIAGTGLDITAPTASTNGLPEKTDPESVEERIAATPIMPETTAAAGTTVVSIKLSAERRDLSRLVASDGFRGLSTAAAADKTAEAASILPDIPDGRLAEEQLGTLCVVEQGDAVVGLRYSVYDLVSGARLSLADFLGVKSMPPLFATLGATADTPYRPVALGLILSLPSGDVCIKWNECPELEACVAKYEMTKAPICG